MRLCQTKKFYKYRCEDPTCTYTCTLRNQVPQPYACAKMWRTLHRMLRRLQQSKFITTQQTLIPMLAEYVGTTESDFVMTKLTEDQLRKAIDGLHLMTVRRVYMISELAEKQKGKQP